MNFNGDHGSGSVMRFLYFIGTVMGIILLYFQIQEYIGPKDLPTIPSNEPSPSIGFGGPEATEYSYSTTQTSGLKNPLKLPIQLSPSRGDVMKNPVGFKWEANPNTLYMIEIRDTEPEKDYSYKSQWVPLNSLEINLPDQAIGNLEWCIFAKVDSKSSTPIQTEWHHFTFDPFKDHK